MHRELLVLLINALTLPKWVAVIKRTGQTGGQDFISRGNALADWAAKEAAYGTMKAPRELQVQEAGGQPPGDPSTSSDISYTAAVRSAAMRSKNDSWISSQRSGLLPLFLGDCFPSRPATL